MANVTVAAATVATAVNETTVKFAEQQPAAPDPPHLHANIQQLHEPVFAAVAAASFAKFVSVSTSISSSSDSPMFYCN